MRRRLINPGLVKPVLVLGGVAIAAGWTARSAYFKPAAELRAKARAHEQQAQALEGEISRAQGTREGLSRMAQRSLGRDLDLVQHRFRTLLNDIAVECGLDSIEVSNGAPAPEASPASRSRIPGEIGRKLKKQIDFRVIRGELKGEGTLDQALRAMAVIAAQPWAMQVSEFSLRPVDADRARVQLRLVVATAWLHDMGSDKAEIDRAPLDEASATVLASLLGKSPFREPPARPVEVAAATPSQPETPDPVRPAAPAYHDWKLVGVVESPRQGVLAWLTNERSGQRLELRVGEPVLDAVFVEGVSGRAIFKIGEARFELDVNQTLDQRKPIG